MDFYVLFVGYSLNDPVLRYMTDAFAAEAAATRGSLERHRAYIFVSFAGRTPPPPDDWRVRGLEPIFYNQAYRHSRLRKTLLAWAGYREDWLSSKGQIIRRFAPVDPRTMSPSDTSNFIWAVRGQKDDEGFGARVLASSGKDTRIEWLGVLHSDERQRSEHYSEARRSGQEDVPSPFLPLGSLTCDSVPEHSLTPTSIALAAWLTSHLDQAETIDWVLRRMQSGSILHPMFRHIVRRALQKEPDLPLSFALFWQIVSAEASWAVMQRNEDHFWHLYGQLAEASDSPLIRMEFLDILRPRLKLRPPMWGRYLEDMLGGSDSTQDSEKHKSFSSLADAEVEPFAGNDIASLIEALDKIPDPDGFLSNLVDELTSLLKQTLDLWTFVKQVDADVDPGLGDRPSIKPHPQNHGFASWSWLIELVWRAWKRIDETEPVQSRRLIERWCSLEYLTFRRLALQAIGESPHWTEQEKVGVILNGF